MIDLVHRLRPIGTKITNPYFSCKCGAIASHWMFKLPKFRAGETLPAVSTHSHGKKRKVSVKRF